MIRSACRLVVVGHAIAVVVRVGLVADPVAVGVQPLSRVQWEGVQFVIDAIAVVVRVGLVADPVAVGVQPLSRVQWEGVRASLAYACDRCRTVAVPVAVRVSAVRACARGALV